MPSGKPVSGEGFVPSLNCDRGRPLQSRGDQAMALNYFGRYRFGRCACCPSLEPPRPRLLGSASKSLTDRFMGRIFGLFSSIASRVVGQAGMSATPARITYRQARKWVAKPWPPRAAKPGRDTSGFLVRLARLRKPEGIRRNGSAPGNRVFVSDPRHSEHAGSPGGKPVAAR